MSRIIGPDCAVICNLLNAHTHAHVFSGDYILMYSRPFHFARVIISVDREWRLRAPDSSVRKARCLYTRNVPRG